MNDNISTDWEGADDLEQDLQIKIKSDMENEPKIENQEISQETLANLEKLENYLKSAGNMAGRLDVESLKDLNETLKRMLEALEKTE